MAGTVKAISLPQQSSTITLQSAASASGNGTVANCDGFNGLQAVELIITGAPASSSTPVAQVYLEGQFANSGSTWYQLGFLPRDGQQTPLRYAAPIYFFNPTIAAPTATGSTTGGKLAAGTYYYLITYGASGPTTESFQNGTGATSSVASGNAGSVALTVIPTGPTGVTYRNIYRSSTANTGPWQLIGSVADNTTTTWTDYGTATPGAANPTVFQHIFYLDDLYTSVRARVAGVSGTVAVSAYLYLLPV